MSYLFLWWKMTDVKSYEKQTFKQVISNSDPCVFFNKQIKVNSSKRMMSFMSLLDMELT